MSNHYPRHLMLISLRRELLRLSSELSELPDWALTQIAEQLTNPRRLTDALLKHQRKNDAKL